MPEITVVMPTLNVVAYIEECLDSVINQSFRDLEIMVIDAGSQDGTIQIVKEYEKRDARVRLYHSEKRSYGYQVNYGIRRASGKYLAIVETDDRILPGMFEILHRVSEETGADYVKGDYENWIPMSEAICFSRTVPTWGSDKRHLYNKVLKPLDYPELLINDIFLWKGIYRTDFLTGCNILLHESDGAAFQDTGFQVQTISFAQRAVYLNQPFYRYRRGNTGASICSPKGFSYLAGEHDYIGSIMEKHPQIYAHTAPYLYARLFDQLAGRVRTMAAFGETWDGIGQAVEGLRRKLRNAKGEGNLDASVFGMQKWMDLTMFLEAPDDYIHCQQLLYKTKRKLLTDLMEYVEGHKKIVLYSRSNMAGFLYCLMRKKGLERAVCFCDNNPLYWGTEYMGLPVCSVEQAVKHNSGAGFIIANARITREMKRQLLNCGVLQGDICLFQLDCDLLLLNM